MSDITIERTFRAPVERVWKAWSEPEMIKKWWGPKDFSAPDVAIDFRVGGKYLYSMRDDKGLAGQKGRKFWSTGTYSEIEPGKKIKVTDSFADEKGNVVSSEEYGMKGFPREMMVTVSFETADGGTKMTLRHEGLPEGGMGEQTEQGWQQSLDKLEKALTE